MSTSRRTHHWLVTVIAMMTSIVSAQTTPTPTTSFQGREYTGWYPPDTHGAVGPNHVITAVNGSVRIMNRAGTVLSTTNLNTFFNRTDTVFDPKFYYDHFADRWIGVAAANAQSANSAVLVMASQTANPGGTWFYYAYDADASNQVWADYPSAGFNINWFALSMNMFPMSSGNATGRLYVFSRQALYGGGTVTPTIFNDTNGFTLVPAVTHDPTMTTLFILQNWNGSSGGRGYVRLLSITGTTNAPQYAEVARPSTTQTWGENGATSGNCMPQSGSTTNINAGDTRMQHVVFRNGSIWATHNGYAGSGSTTRAYAQWWQISQTGTTQQYGRVEDTGGTFHYAFPSIAVNRNNDVLLGFTRCSVGTFASAGCAFRASGDTANTMRAPIVFRAGEASYVRTDGSGRNRWGDYSTTVTDPADDTAFWTSQEYALTGTSNQWSTWWAQVVPPSTTSTIRFTAATYAIVENGGSATISVTRGGNLRSVVSVNYATSNGSATAGSDYTSRSGTLNFADSQETVTFTVPILNDSAPESDETVNLTLSSPSSGAVLGSPSTAVLTITDDNDQPPPTVAVTATDNSAREPSDPGVFTLARTGSTAVPLTVAYTLSGTATNGADYTTLSGSATIPAGSASVTVTVTPIDDAAVESSETVVLTLSANAAYTIGSPGSATVNLLDDDAIPVVTVQATDAVAGEPSDPGQFTVTRSGSSSSALTVNVAPGGAATNGNDYSTIPSTVTIPAGQTSAAVNVNVIDDTLVESTETVTLTVAGGTGYTVGSPSTATVTIAENDVATGNDAFSGRLAFITLNTTGSNASATKEIGEPNHAGNAGGRSVWWTWTATFSGSVTFSTAGSNFDSLLAIYTGTAVGALSAVAANDDFGGGNTSSATFNAVSGTVYQIAVDGHNGASGNISLSRTPDPVQLSTVTINATDPVATEGTTDTGAITLTRSAPTSSSLVVNLAITGTASNGVDFQNVATTYTFPAGASSGSITIQTLDDAQIEVPETAIFTIQASGNYTVGSPSSATVAINDNDTAVGNDMFINAIAMTEATTTGNNTGATKETGEPNHAGNTGGKSVWWYWTSTFSGPVTFSTVGSSFDTILGIYTGTAVAGLVQVAADDDSGGGLASLATLNAVFGTTYRIAVDGYGGASGSITLTRSGDPQPLPVVSITTTDGTAKEGGGDTGTWVLGRTGSTASSLTVLLSFSGTATNGIDYVTLSGSQIIPAGADTFAINLTTIDDAMAEGSETAVVTILPSSSYTVDGDTSYVPGGRGTGTINIADNDIATNNDYFSGRLPLAGSNFSALGSNLNFTKEVGEPNHAGDPGGRSAWWTWTAPVSGSFAFNTSGSSFDTTLAVYKGSTVSALTLVAADNDSGGGSTSAVQFDAVAGNSYEIAVDGYGAATGSIVLNGFGGSGLPEIVVEQPAGTSLTDSASTTSFGSVNVGATSTAVTFTVRNAGTASLTGLAVAKDGNNAADFSVTGLPVTSLGQSESTTFAVTFSPLGSGARTAAIHIASNDPDENPFDITLTGSGGQGFTSVGTTAGGPTWNRPDPGVPPTALSSFATAVPFNAFAFTVSTTGSYVMTSTAAWDNHLFLYSGAFASTSPLAGAIEGDDPFPNIGQASITRTLTAGATYHLVTTGYLNSDSGPYTLGISGPGVVNPQGAPEIVIEQPAGTSLTDGSSTSDFGTVSVGGVGQTLSFVIKNTGTTTLSGIALSINGANASDFSTSGPGVTSLAAGGQATFSVTVSATAAGVRNATLHVTSNDADESPFDIGLAATATNELVRVGNTTGGPLWNRPVAGTPPASLSGTGTAVPYDALSFTVAANGTYTFTSTATGGWDNYLFLYSGSFSAASPLTAAVTGNDDNPNVGVSGFTASLVTGTTYFVVNTGYSNTDAGEYTLRISGPGAVIAQQLDLLWNPNANGNVVSMATQPDGKVLIGGTFTQVGGVTRNNLARLTSTGTLDTSFNPNVNGEVVDILVQPDGKIVIGGLFSLVGGVSRTGLARLNPDGSLDSTLNLNADSFVYGITLQSDGKILISGGFDDIGGVTRNGVARINANGTLDASFANPQFNDTVACTTVQPDGRIIAGGVFTTVGGVSRQRLARLNSNGTLDTTFTQTADNWVYAIAPQTDGTLVIGGMFLNVGGTGRQRIARLGADGALDSAFNPGANNLIYSIATQADGKILIGGTFTSIGGQSRQRLARLNATGQVDSFPNSTIAADVRSVTLASDGHVLIGGNFTSVDGVTRNRVASLLNTLPAIQLVSIPAADRLNWTRGGASPEVNRVTFELSTDGGGTWSSLGAGTRVPGGWERSSLSLPGTGMIRARGVVSAGNFTGSTGIVEQTGSFALGPEIAVRSGPTLADPELADGQVSGVSLGATNIGSPSTRTLLIQNIGSGTLTLGALTKDGANAADFSVGAFGTSSVVSGASTTVTVSFNPSAAGTRSAAIHLASNDPDENPFDINLTGTGVNSNANLASLVLSSGTLSPTFSQATTSYTATVANSVTSITVTATQGDSGATTRINGVVVPSGTPSAAIPLIVGANVISVHVTAPDGTTTKLYGVTVTRQTPIADLIAIYNTGAEIPAETGAYNATGKTVSFTLNYAPPAGAILMVVNNTGLAPMSSRFSNLSHGQLVQLTFGGVTYEFVANYYGGTGNDLVLHWAATRVVGWGHNDYGQAGDGTTIDRLAPTQVGGTVLMGKTVLTQAVGGHHTLALCSDGTLAAWGQNVSGQLGNNGSAQSNIPVAVNGFGALAGKLVVAVSAGNYHSMALCSDGTLATWGFNGSGELGDNTLTEKHLPIAVSSFGALSGKRVVAVSAGNGFSLALCSDGTVAAWGYNAFGQLGINSTVASHVPVAVNTTAGTSALAGKTVVAISAGEAHCLAVCSDGTVASWGYNASGQLGNGGTSLSWVPVAVSVTPGVSALNGRSVLAVAAGQSHSLALCMDGTLAAWGQNVAGQLGNDSVTASSVPVAVNTFGALSGRKVLAISAGGQHSLALCSDGTLTAWGANSYGALGDKTTNTRLVPVAVDTTDTIFGERYMAGTSSSPSLGSLGTIGTPPPFPIVKTLAASAITGTTAVLNATVNAVGYTTSVTFEYGLTSTYGTSTAAVPATVGGSVPNPVSLPVAGLAPATTYHFRAVASSTKGTIRSSDVIFTTPGNNASLLDLVPAVGTLSPSFFTSTTGYTTTVGNNVASMTFTPTTADYTATIEARVNGGVFRLVNSGYPSHQLPLNVGANIVHVKVTAQDGVTVKVYTITVTRQAVSPLTITYNAATDVPVSSAGYIAAGNSVSFNLNFAPVTGTTLMVIQNTGLDFITGVFVNLAQGQNVPLTFGGVTYNFVATYYGGTGNDLVLLWAGTRALSWGRNDNGQLGNGTSADRTTPGAVTNTGVLAGRTITSIATGGYHTLALCADGTLAAWGMNSNGQLGNNSTVSVSVPVAINGFGALAGRLVVAVAAGKYFNLALCSDGTVAAWGFNSDGQLGNNTVSENHIPVAINSYGSLAGRTVVALSAGDAHSVALFSDGTAAAWGYNITGQLGDGSTTKRTIPGMVNTQPGTSALAGKTVVAVRAGESHTLALASDGTVAAWGYNLYGQLGDNTTVSANVPVMVNTGSGVSALFGKTVTHIAAGQAHSMALCSDGTLVSWGLNVYGQLGTNGTAQSAVPVLVNRASGVSSLFGKTVIAIAAGLQHSLALNSDGTTAAWGGNSYGALGDGSIATRLAPVAVNVAALNAGERFIRSASGPVALDSFAVAAAPPAAVGVTLAATSVTGVSATLNGQANPNGGSAGVAFEYGLTTSYGGTMVANPSSVSGSSLVPVSANLTGLVPGTTYHFRIVVGGGSFYGGDMTFATPDANAALSSLLINPGTLTPAFAPSTTSYASTVANADASMTVTPTATDPAASVQVRINGGGFSSILSGIPSAQLALNEGLNLVDLRVTAADGVSQRTYSLSVTRAGLAPLASTLAATSVTATSAVLNGTVTASGASTTVTFDYGQTASYGSTVAAVPSAVTGIIPTTVSTTVSGLAPETTYHYRVRGVSGAGTATGGDFTFTTLSTNANLSGLTVSEGALSPSFSSATTSYNVSVSNSVTFISVIPAAASNTASISTRVNGGSFLGVPSGTSSTPLALNVGTNSIDVRVTAQDGSTTRTYTVLAQRSPPSNAKAQIISPVNGLELASTSLPLVWSPGVGVTSYYLFVGTSAGGYDIYSGDQGTGLNKTVNVPADKKIYVTLYSLIAGAYQANYYVFNSVPSVKANLVSPANGSTLTSSTLSLTWSAGTGVSGYYIFVGSAYGGYDLGAVNAGTATTWNLHVPQDGGPIYITLYSLINGGYQAENYWFNTALPVSGNRQARLTSPANTSTLGSATMNLAWDAGSGVTSYALWVGSNPDGYDLYSGLEGTSFSKSLPIPGDGRRIYVTLHSLISGAYQSNSYWFTAPTLLDGGAAQVTSPVNGSTLADSTLPLVWSSAAGATQYYIFAGSTPGGYDLYAGSQGTTLNRTLSGLPVDGRVVYVTLYSWLNGAWKQSSAWFTTANIASGNKRALITSPANGTTLPGASTTFTWNSGVGATSYALWIGSSAGAYDLWSSAETLATTSRTVTLPTDGRKLYVTLYSFIGGAWQGASYIYTASNVAVTKAAMTSPVNGSTFTGASQMFTWSASNAATMYALWIGRTPGGYDIYAGAEGTNTSRTVTTLPTDGSPVYVTLYSLIKGAWQSNEYIYNAALPP